MDIRKLQRTIVDALEDVKAQAISVFDTTHLSPMFERVVVATGTSNRQTRALASAVRDAVKAARMPVLSVEGEDNGEWIIVDCGPAVVHVMQPAVRDYYRLEELWGEKPVRLRLAAAKGLVKASEGPGSPADAAKTTARAATRKVAPSKGAARKKAAADVASRPPARRAAATSAAGRSAAAPTKRAAAKKATAKRAAATPRRAASAG